MTEEFSIQFTNTARNKFPVQDDENIIRIFIPLQLREGPNSPKFSCPNRGPYFAFILRYIFSDYRVSPEISFFTNARKKNECRRNGDSRSNTRLEEFKVLG